MSLARPCPGQRLIRARRVIISELCASEGEYSQQIRRGRKGETSEAAARVSADVGTLGLLNFVACPIFAISFLFTWLCHDQG